MAELVIKMRRTDLLRQFPEIATQELSDSMAVAVELVTGEAMERAPNDRGYFLRGLSNDVFSPQPVMVIGKVFDTASHAPIVEGVNEAGQAVPFGRRPGTKFPKVSDLRGWVERRLGISDEKQVKRVAYLVGRAIVRRGIKPARPIARARAVKRDEIRKLFFEATERVAKKVEGK